MVVDEEETIGDGEKRPPGSRPERELQSPDQLDHGRGRSPQHRPPGLRYVEVWSVWQCSDLHM